MDSTYKQINGTSLIFTDLHLGIRSDNQQQLKIVLKAIKKILEFCKAEKPDNIIFLGDFFHNRVSLNVNTVNIGIKIISMLARAVKNVYILVGNHDTYFKNSTDINSLEILKSSPKIHLISSAEVWLMNGKKVLLAPWLADLSSFPEKSFDIMMGHFDICTKYLIKSYIEDHSSKSSAAPNNVIQNLIDNDLLLNSTANLSEVIDSCNEAVKSSSPAASYIGSFINLCKEGGVIYSGHIHKHKEFTANGRKFIFVGAPYQQNFGDIDNVTGFYFLDSQCNEKFVKIEGLPTYRILKMSDIMREGIAKFDYSSLSDKMIYKLYDVEVVRKDDIEIDRQIALAKPFEIFPAEYTVTENYSLDTESSKETIEAIKKSKLDYISSYIKNIPKKELEEAKIDPKKLYEMLVKYYNLVKKDSDD